MSASEGDGVEDTLWLIKTGEGEVGPVATDEMVAMIKAGEVSRRTLIRTLDGPKDWQRTDATPLMRLSRIGSRTANKLTLLVAGAILFGFAAFAAPGPATAQNFTGTTSPNYCGTAMVQDLARRIGGRVASVVGNGATEFAAPEIGPADNLSVRCGEEPETTGTYHRHEWAQAFLNAFLTIAEQSVGRPRQELARSMADCRRRAFGPFNRETGFGFSRESNSATAEVRTRWYVLECAFERDPTYSRFGFVPPSARE